MNAHAGTGFGSPSLHTSKGKKADRNGANGMSLSEPLIPEGGPVGSTSLPPGLKPISLPPPASAFLLPAIDYAPTATACFVEASRYADRLLSGSHPLRLSVKLE